MDTEQDITDDERYEDFQEEQEQESHLVFVYGSLMQGFGNAGRLKNSKFIGRGMASGKFRMASLGSFPAAFRDVDGEPMKGELYEVDEETLASLDCLEGNGRFYEREFLDVTVNGWTYSALVYLVINPSEGLGFVESNDWRAFFNVESGK